MSSTPWPWEADNPEEAYELWQQHVDEGADTHQADWRGWV